MVRLLLLRQVWVMWRQSKRAEWVVVALHVSWGSLPLILRHRTSTRHSTNNSCMSASHVIMWIWVRCTVQALHCWVSLFTYSWMVCTSGVVGVQRKQVDAVENICLNNCTFCQLRKAWDRAGYLVERRSFRINMVSPLVEDKPGNYLGFNLCLKHYAP